MQRSYLLIAIFALIISFFILLQPKIYSNSPFTDSLARRRLIYQQYPLLDKLVHNNQQYMAPLHLCESCPRVPDSYIVFLHSGNGLEAHQEVVGNGVDWEHAVKFVFPETRNHGLCYSVELDEEGLSAVRKDIVVDMVECNLYALPLNYRVDWVAEE